MAPPKSPAEDFLGRFREVISDPLNLLIERVPLAGAIAGTDVYLHNGNRVPLVGPDTYYGAFSQLLVINRGVHEPLEEYVFQEMLRILPQAPVMIELGAYWAHYSMWLKKVRPQSTAILIEPEDENLAAGRNNFARNGFAGDFVKGSVGTGKIAIDAFRNDRKLAKIDVLHADVQGAEIEMLDGCRSTLRERRVDYLLIATHTQEKHHDVIAKLAALGYRIEVASDFENDSTSFDGFVFASSPDAKQVFNRFAPLGRTAIAESSPERLLQSLLDIEPAARQTPARLRRTDEPAA